MKALRKMVCSTYDRTFMPAKSKRELKKSIETLKRNRSEVELQNEQRTGEKKFKLDEELLS